MNESLTTEQRVELVMMAIGRIRAAKEEYGRLNAEPRVGQTEIRSYRKHLEAMEAEFGWQWQNVERIFKDRGIIP